MSYLTGGFIVGEVRKFAGVTAPTGWLFCAGQAISRTTYANLFATISTIYGVGDGSTTFNLPDLRGRIPAGKDDMNGTAANRITSGNSGIAGVNLGANGGAETLVSHSHGVGTLATSAHSVSDAGHAHSIGLGNASGGSTYLVPQNTGQVANTTSSSWGNANTATTGISIGNHTLSGSTASTGSGTTHGNMPPTLILNYIIKF